MLKLLAGLSQSTRSKQRDLKKLVPFTPTGCSNSNPCWKWHYHHPTSPIKCWWPIQRVGYITHIIKYKAVLWLVYTTNEPMIMFHTRNWMFLCLIWHTFNCASVGTAVCTIWHEMILSTQQSYICFHAYTCHANPLSINLITQTLVVPQMCIKFTNSQFCGKFDRWQIYINMHYSHNMANVYQIYWSWECITWKITTVMVKGI